MTRGNIFSAIIVFFTIASFSYLQYQQNQVISYSKLENNLVNQEWKQADIETSTIIDKILTKAVDEQKFLGYSMLSMIFPGKKITLMEQLDCKTLKKIDDLWNKHSEGYYGFTVQSIIANDIVNNPHEELVQYRVEDYFRKYPLVNREKEFSAIFTMYRREAQEKRFRIFVKYNANPVEMDKIYSNAINPKENPGLLPSPLWFYKNTPANLSYSLPMIINYNKNCQFKAHRLAL